MKSSGKFNLGEFCETMGELEYFIESEKVLHILEAMMRSK